MSDLPSISKYAKRKESFATCFPFEILHSNNCANNMEYFHWHDFMELSYIRSGRGVYEIENKTMNVEKGDLIIVNNIEKHRVTYDNADKLYETVIHFSPSFIWSGMNGSLDYRYLGLFLYDRRNFNNKLQLDADSLKVFTTTIEEMQEEFHSRRPYYELMLKAKLLTIISLILRQSKSNYGDDKAFARKVNDVKRLEATIEYIHENFTNDISLNAVSRELFMNASYFSEYFKKNMGVSFSEYVIRLKIAKAIELMEDGSRKITAIAFESGFNNLASFYSAFKKLTGMTPGEFAKK